MRADLGDGHPVGHTTQLEVDGAPDLVADLRPPAAGRLEQPAALDLLLVLVGLDRGGDHGDAGVAVGRQTALGADPVDPAGVGAPVDHLGLVEQVEHEALVGRAALDDHGGLGHGPAQPGQRLVPGPPVRDDLGDHRVEVGGDGVAFADTGVDADARAGGQPQQRDPPWRGGEVAVRVLGVEPGLDRVADLDGALALEPATGGDVQLGLDQVDVGRDLGDRVLDLQPGVDLEEGEGFSPGW